MKTKWTNLSCFSPFVMAFTFVIEIGLFLYLFIKLSKKDTVAKIVMAALLLLAAFQVSEYMLCQTDGNDELWVKTAFIAITILPPLGVHLVSAISGVTSNWSRVFIPIAYLNGLIWVIFYGSGLQAFRDYGCATNYAIFDIKSPFGELYHLYYYGWLFIALFLAYHLSTKIKQQNIKKKLTWLMFGYLTFMIPAMTFQYVKPHLYFAIPSVMCGFALIYAFIMVFGIVRPQDKKPAK